jgi:hypothetical protein
MTIIDERKRVVEREKIKERKRERERVISLLCLLFPETKQKIILFLLTNYYSIIS